MLSKPSPNHMRWLLSSTVGWRSVEVVVERLSLLVAEEGLVLAARELGPELGHRVVGGAEVLQILEVRPEKRKQRSGDPIIRERLIVINTIRTGMDH